MGSAVCTIRFVLVLVTYVSSLRAETGKEDSSRCPSNQAAVYNLYFRGHWSVRLFPKDYPRYRPIAQWSQIIGRTHDGSYVLWRENNVSSPVLRQFLMYGRSYQLAAELQGKNGVHDVFSISPIRSGFGNDYTSFMADSKHSMVSMISRLVPSPDWFVGLDSVELCSGGTWLRQKMYKLQVKDGGVDQGRLFTSPKYPETLQKKIRTITSKSPSHPAGSFYYPLRSSLPSIATVVLKLQYVYGGTGSDAGATFAPSVDFPENDLNDTNEDILADEQQKDVYACIVSQWSQWSPCSRTCGFGRKIRRRFQLNRDRKSPPCTNLLDKQRCGSMRSCDWAPFRFTSWSRRNPYLRGKISTRPQSTTKIEKSRQI